MMNKKKIGLGLAVLGGIVATAGLALVAKGIKEDNDLKEEINEFMSDLGLNDDEEDIEVEMEIPSLGEESKVETEVEVKVDTNNASTVCNDESPTEGCIFTSSTGYNPRTEPVSMSQESIERVGQPTF